MMQDQKNAPSLAAAQELNTELIRHYAAQLASEWNGLQAEISSMDSLYEDSHFH